MAAALVALRRSEEHPAESLLHNMAQIAASLASRDTPASAGRLPEACPPLPTDRQSVHVRKATCRNDCGWHGGWFLAHMRANVHGAALPSALLR